MLHKLRPLIALIVIGSLIGGAYWYFSRNPGQLAAIQLRLGLIDEADAAGIYQVSGFIEANDVIVAAETRGRIVQIAAAKGDLVETGQTLIRLDTALLEAQMAQAEAKVATANAHLAKIKAGVRTEEIAKAEAALALAEANALAAQTRWQDTQVMRDNPQMLDMQIDALRNALDLAELQISAAIPRKEASETMWGLGQQQWEYAYDEHTQCQFVPQLNKKICVDFTLPEGVKQDAGVAWNMAGTNRWEAWVNLNTAVTSREDAQTYLNALLRWRNDPQEAQLQVTQAETAYKTAQAEVNVARARLDTIKAGARTEQIAIAEAMVKQAEAGLETLRNQYQKSTLVSPLTGWVIKRTVNEGEMAQPGTTLLTLADITDLTLTVYIPEPDVGLVSLGQDVEVKVDSFPNQTFSGQIVYISDEAEFTPKNVQTKEERVNTVFALKIKLDNESQKLKPGMPADAILSSPKSATNSTNTH